MAAVTILAAAAGTRAPEPTRAVAGQLVDRGTFRLSVDGVEAGTEEFTIQRIGTGDAEVTLARGTINMLDGRTLTTVLQLQGPAMLLVEYSALVTGTDTLGVTLVRSGDRLRSRTVTPRGEEVRQYRARVSTVLFDEGVAHHYFLLGAFADGGGAGVTVHAVAPLSGREEPAAELDIGSEAIRLNGERVEATRISFRSSQGSGAAWFDGSGRLVRVALPGRGFVAERNLEG